MDTFFNTVIDSVVNSVYKVVTWSCFGLIWLHKVTGGTWRLSLCDTFYILLSSYCHSTAIYGYTPCQVIGHVPYALWTHQIWIDMRRPGRRFHPLIKILTKGDTTSSVTGALAIENNQECDLSNKPGKKLQPLVFIRLILRSELMAPISPCWLVRQKLISWVKKKKIGHWKWFLQMSAPKKFL